MEDSIGKALRFTLSVPGVSTAVAGTNKPDRWVQNARLAGQDPFPGGEPEGIPSSLEGSCPSPPERADVNGKRAVSLIRKGDGSFAGTQGTRRIAGRRLRCKCSAILRTAPHRGVHLRTIPRF
ncbi:hypothetical protein [Paenibacillus chitinolyticus]|uniref:hypothetical protein n=1 Tax=Paenibacillus chitinolyticus TaxID=79263 RepID=UPI00210D903C|nr:hypothetical protein [Paenibacillus chitinolyticus]